MIAISTKNFKIKKYIYEWILGIVYVLSIINEKDFLNKDDKDDKDNKDNKNNLLSNMFKNILNCFTHYFY